MSFTVPVVEAKFTLLPELSHGRRGLSTGKYRPHIVIGPESQRVAIREGNRLTENYLGVMFVGGPDSMEPGDAANVKLALMYFPEYPYEEIQPGVTFTVREGPLIVGYGVIQSVEWNLFRCQCHKLNERKRLITEVTARQQAMR